MITLILLMIIALLVGFIVWILKEFFIIMPKVDNETTLTINSKPADIEKTVVNINSVVGETNYVPLVTPTIVSKKVVPSEEIEDVFLNNEFEREYPTEAPISTELPKEEQTEVIETDNIEVDVEFNDNLEIQKATCYDYFQIDNAIHNVVHNKPLSIEDARALNSLEGTDISTQLLTKYPSYMQTAIQALANIEH